MMERETVLKAFDKLWQETYGGDKDKFDYAYYYIRKMLDGLMHEAVKLEVKEQRHALNTPLLALMHDTAHDLDIMRDKQQKFDKWINETKPQSSIPYVVSEYFKSAYTGIRDKLDVYYLTTKQPSHGR